MEQLAQKEIPHEHSFTPYNTTSLVHPYSMAGDMPKIHQRKEWPCSCHRTFQIIFSCKYIGHMPYKNNNSQIWYDFCIFPYYFFALPLLRIWIMSLTAEDTGKEMINIFVVNIKYHIWKNWYSTKCIELTN